MDQDEKAALMTVAGLAAVGGAVAFPAVAAGVAVAGATLGVAKGVFQYVVKPAASSVGRFVSDCNRATAEGREAARLRHQDQIREEEQKRTEAEQLRRENARLLLELQFLNSGGISQPLQRNDVNDLMQKYMNDRQSAITVETRQPLINQTILNLSQANTTVNLPFGNQLRNLNDEHEQRLQAINSLPVPEEAVEEDYREELREIEEQRFLGVVRQLTAGRPAESATVFPRQ